MISIKEPSISVELLYVSLILLAASLHFIGLISPLTPSEGDPGIGDFLIFVGLPILMDYVAGRSTGVGFTQFVSVLMILGVTAGFVLVWYVHWGKTILS